ncbi:APC family permease [Streptomyces sp. NRRL S-1813]|uniref:APC family permease n=1 Tax=Streptomyces sp. NRRL S-1813 TaxID=1463888 RepID=UPI0004C5C9BF|nr:APC family permease [Streptomyces sp. NRRL S-1813]
MDPSEHTLARTLTLKSVVLFGLAYMTPLIVLGTFGVVADTTGGAVPTAYLLALCAMLFTAHSYGKMAAAYPVAGSAYTDVREAIDGRVGFLVGWATLLDYFFLPMVIWLIGAVGLIALRMNVATSTSFINFGAFTAFTFVSLSVLATYLRSRRAGDRPRVLPYVIAPVIGAAVDIWLLTHLDSKAQLLGLIWLAVGVGCLTYLTKGFRRPPPKMDLSEDSRTADAAA